MKSIYLHIGTEKTGTSAIQNFAIQNVRQLLRHNILVLQSLKGNNTELTCYALKDNNFKDDQRKHRNIRNIDQLKLFRKELKQKYIKQINKNKNFNHIFLSNEHLSSRLTSASELLMLKKLLNDFSKKIKIIIYLRRQDQFLISEYSTAIKNGHTKDFQIPDGIPLKLNYSRIISLWEGVFGRENLIIKTYEKESFVNNDLIDDIFDTMGIKIDNSFFPPKKINSSISPEALVVLRRINHYVPQYSNNKLNASKQELIKFLLGKCPVENSIHKTSDFFKHDLYNYYVSQINQNIELAKKYLSRDYLFLGDKAYKSNNNPYSVKDNMDINEYPIQNKLLIELLCEVWEKYYISENNFFTNPRLIKNIFSKNYSRIKFFIFSPRKFIKKYIIK
jgi:hypothetical protein